MGLVHTPLAGTCYNESVEKQKGEMSNRKAEEHGEILTRDEGKVTEPPMYKVVLLNDNYTTMEFVTLILENIFRKVPQEARKIMLSVHEKGSGVAGIYTREVAETKIAIVHHIAAQNEFPLKCAMEPV